MCSSNRIYTQLLTVPFDVVRFCRYPTRLDNLEILQRWIPACAGMTEMALGNSYNTDWGWIPACAGMTERRGVFPSLGRSLSYTPPLRGGDEGEGEISCLRASTTPSIFCNTSLFQNLNTR
jgi:hypothetical protein